MENNLMEFKVSLIAFAGILTGFWGWMGWLVVGWMLCMVLDYITGYMAAMANGEWESQKAREGIYHKFGTAIVVVAAAAMDFLMSTALSQLPILDLPIEYKGLICPVVLVWYIVMELGSICENAVAMGAPVPHFLTKLLAVSKDAVEKVGGEDEHESETAVSDEE